MTRVSSWILTDVCICCIVEGGIQLSALDMARIDVCCQYNDDGGALHRPRRPRDARHRTRDSRCGVVMRESLFGTGEPHPS